MSRPKRTHALLLMYSHRMGSELRRITVWAKSRSGENQFGAKQEAINRARVAFYRYYDLLEAYTTRTRIIPDVGQDYVGLTYRQKEILKAETIDEYLQDYERSLNDALALRNNA